MRRPPSAALRPGDVVAVPDQQRNRTAGWLDLDGNPCETVGRYGYIASLTKVPEPGAVIPLERSAAFVQLAFPCVRDVVN